jgi:hypothetical protein
MKRCDICLNNKNLWNTKCCKIFVHYECQVAWGNECIICKKQLKCVSSTNFRYIPDFPDMTYQEIDENNRAMEQIRRRNTEIPFIEYINRYLEIRESMFSIESDTE